MTETQSGGNAAPDDGLRSIVAGHAKTLANHDGRLNSIEQDRAATRQEIASLQLKLVEVQTEGRMRGERQDNDTRDLKNMISTVLGAISFFKWAGGIAVTMLGFLALYGERLLHFWQVIHP